MCFGTPSCTLERASPDVRLAAKTAGMTGTYPSTRQPFPETSEERESYKERGRNRASSAVPEIVPTASYPVAFLVTLVIRGGAVRHVNPRIIRVFARAKKTHRAF